MSNYVVKCKYHTSKIKLIKILSNFNLYLYLTNFPSKKYIYFKYFIGFANLLKGIINSPYIKLTKLKEQMKSFKIIKIIRFMVEEEYDDALKKYIKKR